MEVLKGYLIKTNQGQLGEQLAQVRTMADEVIDNVLMLYPYGYASRMQREEQEGSLVLLLKPGGSKTNIFGIPYNPLFFQGLDETEVKIGNPKQDNTVTFKANGDIEISTQQNINVNCNDLNQILAGDSNRTASGDINDTATGTVNIVGATVNLADAVGLVLNNAAVMQVTIPGGSSAGTYPVTIVSEGQTKVSA